MNEDLVHKPCAHELQLDVRHNARAYARKLKVQANGNSLDSIDVFDGYVAGYLAAEAESSRKAEPPSRHLIPDLFSLTHATLIRDILVAAGVNSTVTQGPGGLYGLWFEV